MHTSERNPSGKEMKLPYAAAIDVLHTVNTKAMLRIVILVVLLMMGCRSPDHTPCPTRTCNDYKTQAEAQAAFDGNKQCLSELDDDQDGIACEHLPAGTTGGGTGGTGSGSGCPTTAACGCSGNTKAQCGGACCKWTVGSGCGCK